MAEAHDLKAISNSDKIKSMLKQTQILFRQQKYTEAKTILQEILKLDPKNAVAYNNLGSIYLIRGRFTRAKRYFKKALELDPAIEDARENLKTIEKIKRKKTKENVRVELSLLEEKARSLLEEGNTEAAIEVYNRIIDEDPTNIKVYNNLGILYYKLRQLQSAEKCFVKALEMYFHHGLPFDDQYTIIRQNLAKMREKIGSNVSDFLKDNLANELKESLDEDENILLSLLGTIEVNTETGPEEVNAIVALTNKQVIFYYKNPGQKQESIRFDVTLKDIKKSSFIKGIRRNTLQLDTPGGKIQVFSKNLTELRRMHSRLEKMTRTKKPDQGIDILSAENVDTEVLANIVNTMLDTLAYLGVFTPEEIESKKKEINQARKSKDRKRKHSLIPGKYKTGSNLNLNPHQS